jgi:hypothetical protein
MNWTVDWTPEALSHLTAVWLQAPDRQAVTAAQARIDALLAADPLAHGLPRSEGLHAIDVPPLRAVFEVSDADRTVTVVSVNWLP